MKGRTALAGSLNPANDDIQSLSTQVDVSWRPLPRRLDRRSLAGISRHRRLADARSSQARRRSRNLGYVERVAAVGRQCRRGRRVERLVERVARFPPDAPRADRQGDILSQTVPARLVVVVPPVPGPDQPRGDARRQGPQGHEAGADDGRVDLDARPDAERDGVVAPVDRGSRVDGLLEGRNAPDGDAADARLSVNFPRDQLDTRGLTRSPVRKDTRRRSSAGAAC